LIPSLQQPVLGICLGMQLLFESSEEGAAQCLGIISGRASRLTCDSEHPVPHIGWNTLKFERQSALLDGLRQDDYAYFVHSYALPLGSATIASSEYGHAFSACVQWKNFCGAQFHPERSAKVGARLLQNFLCL
jgi:glutamine amidotransferase